MKKARICALCQMAQAPTNSPICIKCRCMASKKACPIPGCDQRINAEAKTCLWHRHLQRPVIYDTCRECQTTIEPSALGLCNRCYKETFHHCACGCGGWRQKYDKQGQVRDFISGHNDSWHLKRRPLKECLICSHSFKAVASRQRLCSIDCRAEWIRINPTRTITRRPVPCVVCGTMVFRRLYQVKNGRMTVCSPRCRAIAMANKLGGVGIRQPKRLALQRDKAKCCVCGFNILVEVHHIIQKHKGGKDELSNMITLCPNHHTMADRGLIRVEALFSYIEACAMAQ